MELYEAHTYYFLDCGPQSFPTEAGKACEIVTVDASFLYHRLSRSVLAAGVKRDIALHGFQCHSFGL